MKSKLSYIIHIDIDAFFASVCELNNSKLHKIPFVVTNIVSRRGIVLTSNYHARKYNIHAGMPIFHALKKCANLKLVPNNSALNWKYHKIIYSLLHENVSKKILTYSIDEWFCDATEYVNKFSNVNAALVALKQLIYEKVKLTVTVGCSHNALLAKIATNYAKPNNTAYLNCVDWTETLKYCSVNLIPGIGQKVSEKLRINKIYTFNDLLHKTSNDHLLNNSIYAWRRALFAIDNDLRIDKLHKESPVTIGFSKSLFHMINTFDDFMYFAELLTHQVCSKAKSYDYYGDVIAINITKADKTTKIKQMKLPHYTNDYNLIMKIILFLVESNPILYKNIKIIGITLKNLVSKNEAWVQKRLYK